MQSVSRWVAAAALAAVLPAGLAAGRTVRIQRVRAGRYDASATYVPFSGSSAVSALANRLLRAEARQGVDAFARSAMRGPRLASQADLAYEHTTKGTICLDRPDLASAYLATDEFSGGAHGMNGFTAVNVGLVHGRAARLKLGSLFRPGASAVRVAAGLVRRHLRADPRAAWLAPDASPEFRPRDADLVATFVITPAGLAFLIPPYVAGPYASGSFTVKVPFSELGDALDPAGPLRPVLRPAARTRPRR